MRIRSLRVRNFKGIEERSLEFPDHGVVVVEGPNEIGKSSLLEALHLLLTELDSARKQKIKETQPVGRDEGPEVEAEIVSGPYRFHLFKRFLKKPETVLRILEPQPHELTGRAAHERVQAILDESMDRTLWEALQVTQEDPLSQASLSKAQSLASALDRSAGQQVAGARESTLFDRVKQEYLRYFTNTGRDGKALQESAAAVEEARASLDETTARIRRLEDNVASIERLYKETERLATQLGNQQTAQAQRRKELEELEKKAASIETLGLQAKALTASENATRNAQEARRKRIEALTQARDACERLEADTARQAPDLQEAEAAAREATETLERAEAAATQARALAELRERDYNHLRFQNDLEQLRERRTAIDAARERMAQAEAQLEALRVDADTLRALREARDSLQRAEAQADTRSPQLFLTAERDLSVTLDGEERKLARDERLERSVGDRLDLAIEGLLRLELRGGAGTRDLREAVAAKREAYRHSLREAGVDGLEEAEAALRGREQAALVIEQCEAQIKTARRDLTYEVIVEKITKVEAAAHRYLSERPAEPPPPDNYDDASAANREARNAAAAAGEAQREARARADAVRARHADIKAKTESSRLEIRLAQRTLEQETQALEQERAQKPDDAVEREFEQARERAAAARGQAEEAQRALGPGRVLEAKQLADNAVKAVARTEQQRVDLREQLLRTRTEIDVLGGEGLFEVEQQARTTLEHASRRHERLTERAEAAKLLHDTMAEEEQAALRAYAAPLRDKIAQLGRLVYHESFAVELDESLAIRTRTLRGRTIPFASLSVGAREQLGLITRLACALLVDEENGVPVVLDDMLGSTDPVRLEGLGAMLSIAGERAQIIVLTCTPDRFRHVGDATVIPL